MHLAIEEIGRRFEEVVHKHNPRKHLHIHVIASRVRLEMKSAFTDVKDRIKVRLRVSPSLGLWVGWKSRLVAGSVAK